MAGKFSFFKVYQKNYKVDIYHLQKVMILLFMKKGFVLPQRNTMLIKQCSTITRHFQRKKKGILSGITTSKFPWENFFG
jgi:hypothetical protein